MRKESPYDTRSLCETDRPGRCPAGRRHRFQLDGGGEAPGCLHGAVDSGASPGFVGVTAGICGPTFGANRYSLSDFGLENQVADINRRLVALCREGVGPSVLVAGDLTTTGKMEPQGDLTYEDLLDIYREQIEALAEAGVDLCAISP